MVVVALPFRVTAEVPGKIGANGRALGNYDDLRAELERLGSPGCRRSSAIAQVVRAESGLRPISWWRRPSNS
jgi:hypothetical protein